LRYVKLRQDLLTTLQNEMKLRPYLMNFSKIEMRAFSIASGATSFSAHNMHYGNIPSRMLVMFLPTVNFQGTKGTSPYKFSNVNLNNHSFVYNSVSLPPQKIEYSMDKSKGVELYYHVCKQLGLTSPGITPYYTYKMFLNDTFILAQDFRSDVSISEQTQPGTFGSLGIELSFASALTANTTMLALSQFDDALITISGESVVVS
jgi:hypothetical protein